MNTQDRPRAVFSIEDFKIMREALAHYLQTTDAGSDSVKFASLYHRLGRVDPAPAKGA